MNPGQITVAYFPKRHSSGYHLKFQASADCSASHLGKVASLTYKLSVQGWKPQHLYHIPQ